MCDSRLVNNFLQMRLAPDMLPFVKQIQICSDTAKGACARLSGQTAPKYEDNEATIEELIARIDKTVMYISGFKAEDFADYQSAKIMFPRYPGVYISGADYLASHALPNFYFHMTTAYNILRLHGLEIGKGDYLGEQNWIKL